MSRPWASPAVYFTLGEWPLVILLLVVLVFWGAASRPPVPPDGAAAEPRARQPPEAEEARAAAIAAATAAEEARREAAVAAHERDEARRSQAEANGARDAAERDATRAAARAADAGRERDAALRDVRLLRDRLSGLVDAETVVRKELLGLKGELRRVVVLVDRSASMSEGGRWPDTLRTVRAWLEYLPVQELALVVFNDQIDVYPADRSFLAVSGADGAANRRRLLKHLEGLQPDGGTHTLQALRTAYEFRNADTFILFTDGAPTSPAAPLFDAAQVKAIHALVKSNFDRRIVVNSIGVGSYFDQSLGEFLLRLAAETGGAFHGR
jgi:hypothetical protein